MAAQTTTYNYAAVTMRDYRLAFLLSKNSIAVACAKKAFKDSAFQENFKLKSWKEALVVILMMLLGKINVPPGMTSNTESPRKADRFQFKGQKQITTTSDFALISPEFYPIFQGVQHLIRYLKDKLNEEEASEKWGPFGDFKRLYTKQIKERDAPVGADGNRPHTYSCEDQASSVDSYDSDDEGAGGGGEGADSDDEGAGGGDPRVADLLQQLAEAEAKTAKAEAEANAEKAKAAKANAKAKAAEEKAEAAENKLNTLPQEDIAIAKLKGKLMKFTQKEAVGFINTLLTINTASSGCKIPFREHIVQFIDIISGLTHEQADGVLCYLHSVFAPNYQGNYLDETNGEPEYGTAGEPTTEITTDETAGEPAAEITTGEPAAEPAAETNGEPAAETNGE